MDVNLDRDAILANVDCGHLALCNGADLFLLLNTVKHFTDHDLSPRVFFGSDEVDQGMPTLPVGPFLSFQTRGKVWRRSAGDGSFGIESILES